MAAPTIYYSTDASAPALDGTVGSLINVLDGCLVNGYGAKAAAGWSKPYTGTNSADYRQGGSGMYVEVNDNGPGAGGAKEARIRGYEVMTAFNTGTGLFPTTAQLTNGCFVRKSNTADGTARAWIVAADDRTFYMFVLTGDSSGIRLAWGFGDIYSVLAADSYKVLIAARATENSASVTTVETFGEMNNLTTQAGHYLARYYTQLGTSRIAGKNITSMPASGISTQPWNGPLGFPNGGDSGIYTQRVWIAENNTTPRTVRGWMRGLRCGAHAGASFADLDTFQGVGDDDGRSFLVLLGTGGTSGTSTGSYYIVETSEWETSV